MITNEEVKEAITKQLWFDEKMEWLPTFNGSIIAAVALWFDEKMEWLPTLWPPAFAKDGCGLMKKWNDYQPFLLAVSKSTSCGLMKKWNDYQHKSKKGCQQSVLWFDEKMEWLPTMR